MRRALCRRSSRFALRSWLYILLHWLVAAPAAWWYGAGAGKVAVFVTTRAALGLVSALAETLLFRCAASRGVGVHISRCRLVLLTRTHRH